VILTNGIEVEAALFGHAFARRVDDYQLKQKLAQVRRIEQQHVSHYESLADPAGYALVPHRNDSGLSSGRRGPGAPLRQGVRDPSVDVPGRGFCLFPRDILLTFPRRVGRIPDIGGGCGEKIPFGLPSSSYRRTASLYTT
jgi:hypothetical protein